MNKALLSSKNMCWCTPQDLFNELNKEFDFVLDPAATAKSAKCRITAMVRPIPAAIIRQIR